MKTTELELQLINLIANNEYISQEITDDVWFFSVSDSFDFAGYDAAQLSGVVSSAIKKGFVEVQRAGTKDHTINLTTLGADTFYSQA
jgi:hypothetical protein